jgi:predicted esterase
VLYHAPKNSFPITNYASLLAAFMKTLICSTALIFLIFTSNLLAQDKNSFSWVNPLTQAEMEVAPGLSHQTFKSKIIREEIGYCIFVPPGYDAPENRNRRYPVIYMLHGGRPGDESKFANKLPYIHEAILGGQLVPTIVVLNNGGPVSHYNVPGRKGVLGKDIFIKELIPLIDKQYRTIAKREGRGLQGYSQGGRAVARIGFGHPEMFSYLVIGSAGATAEKRIHDTGGTESENLVFAKGDDMWTYAETYAKKYKKRYPVEIFLHVGDILDSNYEGNLAYEAFLAELGLDHTFVIIPDQKHSSTAYVRIHDKIIAFQNHSFEKSLLK